MSNSVNSLSKHAFGKKESIDDAKASGAINEYDIIYMDNGEIGWLDGQNKTVINTPRTQKEHTLNGVSIGGLENGDTIPAHTSIDEFIKMITQKCIPATYSKPTIRLVNVNGPLSVVIESGSSFEPHLRAEFVQNDAGDMLGMSIMKGNGVLTSGDSHVLEYTGEKIIIGDETITFKARADYAEAPLKQDNLGNDSEDNRFAGGSITSAELRVSGKRKLYYGAGSGKAPIIASGAIRGLSNSIIAPTEGTKIVATVQAGQQHLIVAYPATMRDISKITYVEANDGNMRDNFTKVTTGVADARGGNNGVIQYKVYVYELAVPAAAKMTFEITI